MSVTGPLAARGQSQTIQRQSVKKAVVRGDLIYRFVSYGFFAVKYVEGLAFRCPSGLVKFAKYVAKILDSCLYWFVSPSLSI